MSPERAASMVPATSQSGGRCSLRVGQGGADQIWNLFRTRHQHHPGSRAGFSHSNSPRKPAPEANKGSQGTLVLQPSALPPQATVHHVVVRSLTLVSWCSSARSPSGVIHGPHSLGDQVGIRAFQTYWATMLCVQDLCPYTNQCLCWSSTPLPHS
jgi:hypothetical protein